MRSDSDNWRTLREEQEEEEAAEAGGSWRITGSRREGNALHNTHLHLELKGNGSP